MLRIIVAKYNTPNGSPRAVAKVNGKQSTIKWDLSKNRDQNMNEAAATLAAKVLTPEQRAKVLHPTAGQRIRLDDPTAGTRFIFLDV